MPMEDKVSTFLDIQAASRITVHLFDKIKQENCKKNSTDEDPSGELEADDDEDYDFDPDEEDLKRHPALVSIFEVITKDPDSSFADTYILKIFEFQAHLTNLMTHLSNDIMTVIPFVQSGLAWRLLEYFLYYESRGNYSDRIGDVNYQNMLDAIEKMGVILRNLLIFSNEAYTLKLTVSSNGQRMIGIFTSREKSPQLMMILNKLETLERTILSKFHESLINILGKKLL